MRFSCNHNGLAHRIRRIEPLAAARSVQSFLLELRLHRDAVRSSREPGGGTVDAGPTYTEDDERRAAREREFHEVYCGGVN